MSDLRFFQYGAPCDSHAHMRAHAPVYWSEELSAWLVFRYEDVRSILLDSETFSAQGPCDLAADLGSLGGGFPNLMFSSQGLLTVNNTDPPQQRALRKDLAPQLCLDRQRNENLQGTVERFGMTALGYGRVDLVSDLVRPVALSQVLDMVGISEAYLDDISRYQATLRDSTRYGLTTTNADLIPAAVAELAGRVAPDRLASTLLLLVAGEETVTSLVAAVLFRLIRDPALWRIASEDRQALIAMLQETLRLESPIQAVARICTQPCVIAEYTIRPDDPVVLMLASANRDEAVFPCPDQFNWDRDQPGHLALGAGSHYCPGHALGIAEALALVSWVFRQFPEGPPSITAFESETTLMFRGLKRLWIEMGPVSVESSLPYFHAVQFDIPRLLVSDKAQRHIAETAAQVPASCALGGFGYECALAGDSPVDIGYQLPANGGWESDLLRVGAPQAVQGAWQRWRDCLPVSRDEMVAMTWAEFDASRSTRLVPSLFWLLRSPTPQHDQLAAVERIARTVNESAPWRILDMLRPEWNVDKFGFMLSRRQTPMRLCLRAPAEVMHRDLSRFSERDDGTLEQLLVMLTRAFPRVDLVIDALPYDQRNLAFECSFRQSDPDEEPGWRRVLSQLVDLGWAEKERAEAALAFCGHTSITANPDAWPVAIRRRWLSSIFEASPVIVRTISHLKFSMAAGGAIRVKAYLGAQLKWVSLGGHG